MTDLGESKAVPERWREVYDNYKSKEGVFESVERVQGRYWCHRAVEELGTAEATIREQAQTIERLTDALSAIKRRLVGLIESGDCGSFDWRTEDSIYIADRILDELADRRAASQNGESHD